MLREHIFSINLNNFQKRGGDRGGGGGGKVARQYIFVWQQF